MNDPGRCRVEVPVHLKSLFDPEDLAQEAALRAWRSWRGPGSRPGGRPGPAGSGEPSPGYLRAAASSAPWI